MTPYSSRGTPVCPMSSAGTHTSFHSMDKSIIPLLFLVSNVDVEGSSWSLEVDTLVNDEVNEGERLKPVSHCLCSWSVDWTNSVLSETESVSVMSLSETSQQATRGRLNATAGTSDLGVQSKRKRDTPS